MPIRRSSGTQITEHPHDLNCDSCEYDGEVWVRDDTETYECWWVCPDCDAVHDMPWDFDDDPDRWRE